MLLPAYHGRGIGHLFFDAREAHARTGPLIVFVGRLEWEKGAHTLIDALPRLRRRIPGVRAVIAQHALAPTCGATSPHPQVVVVRLVAPVVEPAMDLLRSLRRTSASKAP